MTKARPTPDFRRTNRRTFLAAAGLAGTAALSIARGVHAAGGDTIRMAFIGCGSRGTGACANALNTGRAVKLVAMADLFKDRIEMSLKHLSERDDAKEKIDVPAERRFYGFDAYHKAIACDVDLVLLTTPPVFRPMQYAAAVAAGKHVFMEKPCCVDAPGYRSLVESNKIAKEKKLSVVVGFQRRHQKNYIEGIRRIRDGEAGRIKYVRTYFNMPGGGHNETAKPATMTEMEWQIRRWPAFLWLCGDHNVEQAVHEIDIANWVLGNHPVRANGMGGRQVRTGRGNGNIWDHHFVEYEHADGVRHFCQARQIDGTWSHVSDNVHGAEKTVVIGSGPYGTGVDGYRTEKQLLKDFGGRNPYDQEHVDLQASILGGPHVFAGDYGAESSFTAVLGRMATYSGQVVSWDEAVQSHLDFLPKKLALDADTPNMPDASGNYPIAMPGVTKGW
jgi:myo-inositol 2-dehydrogenase / D-chiro-inositol 1-dehydrogenase